MTAQEFPNSELFDEAYANALAKQEARSAAIGAAGYATTLLKHSKIYCRKPRYDSLIFNVLRAIYLSWIPADDDQSKPMRSLVTEIYRQNFAQHFLRAWKNRSPQLNSLIEEHGLYFVGLAALSQSKPGDSVVAICELLCMINTWNAGQISQGKKKAAEGGRKPEREFIKKIIIDMIMSEELGFDNPKISARCIWNEAKNKNNYKVHFNKRIFNFSSCTKEGKLHVDYFEIDDEGEYLEKDIESEAWNSNQFRNLVGKLKIEIKAENNN